MLAAGILVLGRRRHLPVPNPVAPPRPARPALRSGLRSSSGNSIDRAIRTADDGRHLSAIESVPKCRISNSGDGTFDALVLCLEGTAQSPIGHAVALPLGGCFDKAGDARYRRRRWS